MKSKKEKRVTIYDIAASLGIAPSSVSKALNDQPSVSDKIKALVKAKVSEMNYVSNSNAANLRRGASRTIGVVVPKVNTVFFSEAIAGMEEVCFEHNHSLIICQSGESYVKEVKAVETLIRQNVDCIIISLSQETIVTAHLEDIIRHHIPLIQFDRVNSAIPCHTVVNDNRNAAYHAVKHLIAAGYRKIALFGGAEHVSTYQERKEGYLKAIRESDLNIPYNYIVENTTSTDSGLHAANELLKGKNVPDAFFAVSDYAALGALKAVTGMGLQAPTQVGIMGFSNEPFTELISPGISSVDQNSRVMGRETAGMYFDHILAQKAHNKFSSKIINCELIIRSSSSGKKSRKKAQASI
jgi:LacI family transcriptional regulator